MSCRIAWHEWRWVSLVSALIVCLSVLPYLIVWLLTPPDLVYSGFLTNPLDGHTYLAKMRQGADGDWLFRLPFTSEPQRGVFFFAYYLALGHLSAWLGLPLITVYHVARCAGGFLLLLVGYRFIAEFLPELRGRRVAFLILAFSSGLGWLMAMLGVMGLDLWVAEANTFYSIFVNAHFALAQALIMLIFLAVAAPLDQAMGLMNPRGVGFHNCPSPGAGIEPYPALRLALSMGASLALAIVMPLALAPVFTVLALFLFWRTLSRRVENRAGFVGSWTRAITAGLACCPFLVYYFAVVLRDPAMTAWSAQNVTPTPAFRQLLAGYGFLVPLALLGVGWGLRRGRTVFLLTWVSVTAAFVYAPIALQRRMLIGFHAPIAILAALGFICVIGPLVRRRESLMTLIAFLLLTPTTLVLLSMPVIGAMKGEWPLFMTGAESEALQWLREQSPRDSVVLASPQVGLMVPALAGNRVIYGHPFETIDAARKQAEVERFFAGQIDPNELLSRYDIHYVFVGPKERALGGFDAARLSSKWSLDTVYTNDGVTIYRVAAGRRLASSPAAH